MLNIPSVRERRRTSLGQVSGGVAIHDAVVKGKIHLAKFILDAVESHTVVNSRDTHGKTPLIRAMRIDEEGVRLRVVDLLLKYNADVNLVDNVGRSALSYACELHRNVIIRKLIKNNVDPNLLDKNGDTPLMYCAMTGNATGIEMLSKSFRRLGLEVDRVNADGMTPLMVAGKNGFVECAHLLAHEAKASVHRRDNVHNMNAIDWAREGGCSTPDVEALQPRSRAHSRATVDRPSDEKNKNSRDRHYERAQPVCPVASTKGLTSSLPQIDSYFGRESHHKNTGSQPDIRSLHNDKRRLYQLSLGELSKKFQDVNKGFPQCKPRSSSDDVPNSTSCEKSLTKKWGSYESNLIDSQCRPKLITKSTPDDLDKPHENVHLGLQELAIQYPTRPLSAVGVSNKHCQQHVGNHQTRRPVSATIAGQLSNRQSRSFDLTSTNSSSNSTETLSLSFTQLPPAPHRHDATKANLYKRSQCSRSTEVLWQGKHSSDHSKGPIKNTVITDYPILRGTPKTVQEGNISLSAADQYGFLTKGDTHSNDQHLGHLPPLSSASTSH